MQTESRLEEANQRLQFLSEASAELASSLDYETTLSNVARLAVPHLADWCSIHIVQEDGAVRQLAVAHSDPDKIDLARDLERRTPFEPNAPGGAAAVIRTGNSQLLPEIPDSLLETATADPDTLHLLRTLGLKSAMVIPLRARARTLGAITFVSAESGRRYTSGDLQLAEDLGRRAAMAVDNARLHRDALRVAAEQAAILGQMVECVTMCDSDGTILYMNEAARRHIGESDVGSNVEQSVSRYNIQKFDGSPYPSGELPLSLAIRGETVTGARWRLKRADGHQAVMEGNAAPVVTGEGVLLGAVCTYRDITEQVNLEQQKDAFLSSVAHDLKTPLTAVKGLAQVMQRKAVRANTPEMARLLEDLTTIDKTANRMTAMVNELLDLARIQMDRPLDLNRRWANLMPLVTATVDHFRATSKRHDITLVSDSDALWGMWDDARLERVLTNLLSNAVKYSPSGGAIGVWVRLHREGDLETLVLTVSDEGLGIPASDVGAIFERFHRASNALDIPGTGIGLAGAMHIVQQHGGAITVESREGTGSTFEVRLPVIPDENVEMQSP